MELFFVNVLIANVSIVKTKNGYLDRVAFGHDKSLVFTHFAFGLERFGDDSHRFARS